MTPSATDIRRLTVSIDTTAIEDLYGYHFSIRYDKAVLELIRASPSPVLAMAQSDSYWHLAQKGTQLELMHTRQGAQEGVTAEGALATLVFDVKGAKLPAAQLPLQLVETATGGFTNTGRFR